MSILSKICSWHEKNKARKNEKMKLEDKRDVLEDQHYGLLDKWAGMLVKNEKFKIIKSESKDEFEKEYKQVINELKKRKRGDETVDLGDVNSISTGKLEYKDGFFLKTVSYQEYELADGVDIETYKRIRKNYDNVMNKLEQIEKTLIEKGYWLERRDIWE